MILAVNHPAPRLRGKRRGFTLIELILVMALLIVIVSIVTPKLAQFFGTRSLDNEVRQFVALTRYGQNRAVAEGIPMFLWVNPQAGAYGLRQETGYTDNDPKAVEYRMADGVKLGLGKNTKNSGRGKLSGIHFSPDGTVVTATSADAISITEMNHMPVWIVPAANGLGYETKN